MSIDTIQDLLIDLGWEFDRMSGDGKDTYNKLCKAFNIEEMKEL
jgi:hypothetical protein